MRLHVLGNVTEDILFRVPRLPLPGETLIANRRDRDIGGKGLNQALIAARCGLTVSLSCPVGEDTVSADLIRQLADEPLQANLVLIPECSTDQSIISVSEDGENHIVSSTQAADSLTPDDAIAALQGIETGDILLVQGNLSYPTTSVAIKHVHARAGNVIVNPSPIRWDYSPLLPFIDVLVLNVHEGQVLSGQRHPAEAAAYLLAAGAGEVVMTLGAAGAQWWRDGEHAEVPSAPTQVVDTAGAGDTFCSTYIAARARNATAAKALAVAANAAAITVSRHGTWSAFPSKQELARLFDNSRECEPQ